MWCNQIFSLINENEVQNIIVCDNFEVASQIARMQYGDDAIAVDTTQYALNAGCKYIDGVFYEDDGETLIHRNPTTEEAAELALQKTNNLETQQAELAVETDYRLSLLELGLN